MCAGNGSFSGYAPCSACEGSGKINLGHNFDDGVCSCGIHIENVFYLTNKFSDGDRVIIYNPSYGVAMSAEIINNFYKAGVAINPEDDIIETDNVNIIWTVVETEGGFYLTDCNNNYLATADTHSLPIDGDHKIWNISLADSAGSVYLRNDHELYLEWYEQYNDFSAFSYSSDFDNRYTMQIYTAGKRCPHIYESEQTSPTCTEQGYTTYICTLCDKSYIDDYVEALGHNWDEGTVTISTEVIHPTCTQEGYTTYTCNLCRESYTGDYVDALGHAWDEGTVTSYPDVFSDGEMFYCCSRCDETKTEIIPADTHSYSTEVIHPTCKQEGYTIYSCNWCRQSYYDDYVDALGHAWDEGTVTISPTFSKIGEITFYCTRCNTSYTEAIPATGGEYKPCNSAASCPSAKFKDVKESDWFHESVDFAVTYGLFSGTSNTTFSPNANMTRAMLVTVLWRYAGQPKEGTNTFTDVKNGQWYTDAVTWAAKNGVVTGVGNNKFSPNGNVTREQLATILYRYAIANGIDVRDRADLRAFSDGNKVSSYAADAIKWAVAERLINGSGGKLMPQGNATRAQVAAILTRFVQNVAG